jgi:hypothetical protein
MIDALLRYHFHIDPDMLDDETWAMRWNELKEVLKFENERNGLSHKK